MYFFLETRIILFLRVSASITNFLKKWAGENGGKGKGEGEEKKDMKGEGKGR